MLVYNLVVVVRSEELLTVCLTQLEASGPLENLDLTTTTGQWVVPTQLSLCGHPLSSGRPLARSWLLRDKTMGSGHFAK